jgi:stress response protein YsnF
VSIPVLEEQLVIEKRLVVTERLLVRKRVEVKEQRVTADLTREVVTVDSDEAVDERVHVQEG